MSFHRLLAALLIGIFAAVRVDAHALDPGYLSLSPAGEASWQITWRVPQVSGQPMPIAVGLPDSCTPGYGPPPSFDGRAFVTAWTAECSAPLEGAEITIDGLSQTRTDVLVSYTPEVGASTVSFRLTPDAASLVLPVNPGPWTVLSTYFWLGLDHIATGLDHLLFVLALMLLVPDLRRLVAAITSFTVAHSITLGAAALGWVTVPSPPVEALIAVSIVLLAAEVVWRQRGRDSFTARNVWTVAFAFGLLHGLGFATALREIGLPENDVLLALLAFNLGVEAGQLLFVAVLATVGGAFAYLASRSATLSPRALSRLLTGTAYTIGSIGAFWAIERFVGLLS